MSRRSLGTLTVDLILKMGGFEQGMDRASRQTKARMREIRKSVDETAKRVRDFIAIGAAAVAAGAAITGAMVNSARQSIDAQSKLARSLDTTYDSLTALQLRAGDSGIDTLDESLNRMNRRLGAVEMNAGPAVKTVKALRLDLEAMAEMDVDQRIGYIGDRIRDLGISNEEAARHLQQLGFEQKAALELFKNGSADVQRYRNEVEWLGLSVNELDAQRIEQMNDALGIFGDMQMSLANRLTVAVAPSILSIAESIEQAWIQTDNFGMAAEDFEGKFRGAMAGSLEATADLMEFMDQRGGDIATYGLIGYLFFGRSGRAGLAIGATLGALFSQVRIAMAQMGVGVDEQAAELIRTENRIRSLQALIDAPGVGDPRNRESSVAGWQSEIDELTASAQTLRDAMSESAMQEYVDNFVPDAQAVDGFSGGIRELAENLRNLQETAAGGMSTSVDGGIDLGLDPDQQSEILALFTAQEEALHRQIALFGDVGDMATLMYEMEHGALEKLNPMMKERLWYLQMQLDGMSEEEKARKKQEAEIERQRKATEQFAIQAARNVQSHLAEYLFDPFDEGLQGMLKGLGNTLRRMASEIAAQKSLEFLFKSMSNSSVSWLSKLGNTFAGAFDGGGNIPAGQWGIVGEIGPEIVRGPAMVTSREDTARTLGGGVSINVINNAGVNVRQGETRFDGGRTTIDLIVEATRSALRDGQLDQDFAAMYGLTRAGGQR